MVTLWTLMLDDCHARRACRKQRISYVTWLFIMSEARLGVKAQTGPILAWVSICVNGARACRRGCSRSLVRCLSNGITLLLPRNTFIFVCSLLENPSTFKKYMFRLKIWLLQSFFYLILFTILKPVFLSIREAQTFPSATVIFCSCCHVT